MKVITTITHFEGTPEEYAQAQPHFSKPGFNSDESGSAPAAPVLPDGAPKAELSTTVIEKALTRITLSKNQAKVLAITSKAGDAGLYTSEIAAKAGITQNQLTGVLGSLGRRIANTRGWPKHLSLGDSRWESDVKQRRYWLHPRVREVLSSGRVKL